MIKTEKFEIEMQLVELYNDYNNIRDLLTSRVAEYLGDDAIEDLNTALEETCASIVRTKRYLKDNY